ncbi:MULTISPECIES: Stp1/IreP family PP2C-type Ser/Thr phosphatase [unclassified Veillonella]|uniref:Stp1/IreP family PP2C-type Ser/Thr phosphatase n=1 Tax=unclassified Veillonella TaxID=2630086 RepID=UPI000F8E000E|nr:MULTISPECIES: Stp1/IreP family PP2C-type Ser/Thr phosphatase [unclassified Veillonella]
MISLGISKTGLVRQRNEDRFYAQGPLLIVADGMGGYTGGEYASTMVVDTIVEVVNEATEISTEVLESAILKANRMVYEKSQSYKELEGMGTTAVVAYVQEDTLYWAHVGDSRLYLYGQEGLHRMTKDHSMVQQLVEAGTITEDEVIHHPKRNMLTRAIGVYETVEVDTGVVEVHQNDRILLCSDGLSGYIEESKIEQVLSEENNESRALEDLVHLVYDAGARDNVTIVLGRI